MVYTVSTKTGKVSYRSRFLQSQSYKKNMAANRIVVSEFGTVAHPDPCKTIFQRYVQRPLGYLQEAPLLQHAYKCTCTVVHGAMIDSSVVFSKATTKTVLCTIS